MEKVNADSMLGRVLPALVKEFNLAMTRADTKQKEADDLCRRLMDASSSVIGLQGEKLQLEQQLAETKVKPMVEAKGKPGVIDEIAKEVKEMRSTVDQVRTEMRSAVEQVITEVRALQRLMVATSRNSAKVFSNAWPAAIAATGGLAVYVDNNVAGHLKTSSVFKNELEQLQKMNLMKFVTSADDNVRTYLSSTVDQNLAALFFVDFGKESHPDDDVVQCQLTAIRIYFKKLRDRLGEEAKVGVVSLATEPENAAYALKAEGVVEEALAANSSLVLMNSAKMNDQDGEGGTNKYTVEAGLAAAVKLILAQKNIPYEGDCQVCGGFCQADCEIGKQDVSLDADSEEDEAGLDAEENETEPAGAHFGDGGNNGSYKIPRVRGPIICWGCGKMRISHEEGNFCNPASLHCSICDLKGLTLIPLFIRS